MDCANKKSAKIYTFPDRFGTARSAARLAKLEAEALACPMTEFGSSWYHDEAIAQSRAKTRS